MFINSIAHFFFEKIQLQLPFDEKAPHQFIFCLKLFLSSKLLSLFYPFLSSRWFKIKCSFINENYISPVSILISFAQFCSFIILFLHLFLVQAEERHKSNHFLSKYYILYRMKGLSRNLSLWCLLSP